MFKDQKKRYVNAKEFNEHLKYCYDYRTIYKRKYDPSKDVVSTLNAYLEDCLIYVYLTYRKGYDICTYIFRKDGAEKNQDTDGAEAYRILNLYYKVPDFRNDPNLPKVVDDEGKSKFVISAAAFLYKNPKYEGKRVKAISYDLNSAYSYAMLQDMPDTSVPYQSKKIIEGKEIGFIELPSDDDPSKIDFVPKYKGHSDYVFPLMESPFKKFVENWYKKKKKSDTKMKAKGVLNFSVGYLQKTNPFLRAAIIGKCNEYMKNLIDENTIYCNTDSIVSLVPRNDLNVGDNIGQFKVENEGEFAFKGFNYQWNKEPPSYRGISKAWFKKGWDILKDPLPKAGNVYKIVNYKLERVKYNDTIKG